MSKTLTISGDSSTLIANYFPPIELEGKYMCGLIDFNTYHSIPNVDLGNNIFHLGKHAIEIPVGSYELDDIAEYLEHRLNELDHTISFTLEANHNTLKSSIFSSEQIFFNRPNSIGSLLGFSSIELEGGRWHSSDKPVNISKINIIRVECSIVSGSFINDKPSHTLHEFSLNVSPGYKIDEVPHNVIYLPVKTQQISSITIRIVDQAGDLVNFRKETITLRLHLKPYL